MRCFPYSNWSFYIARKAARRLLPKNLQFFVLLQFHEKYLDYGAHATLGSVIAGMLSNALAFARESDSAVFRVRFRLSEPSSSASARRTSCRPRFRVPLRAGWRPSEPLPRSASQRCCRCERRRVQFDVFQERDVKSRAPTNRRRGHPGQAKRPARRRPGQAQRELGSQKGRRCNSLRARISLRLSGMTGVERAASGMIIRWSDQRGLLKHAVQRSWPRCRRRTGKSPGRALPRRRRRRSHRRAAADCPAHAR